MADHIPTPWEVNGSAIETVASPAFVIASVYEGDAVAIDSATADANAAFIVKCVNCHDELKECIRLLLESAGNSYPKKTILYTRHSEIEARARAALSKATGA